MADQRVTVRIHLEGLEPFRTALSVMAFDLLILRIMHGWAPRQLEAHAYPGQPTHHSTPPLQPCTCWYTAWCCNILLSDPQLYYECDTTGALHLATGFSTNPLCQHHGRGYHNVTVPRWMLD